MRNRTHSRKPIEFDGVNRVGFELESNAVIRRSFEGVDYGE